MRRHAALLLALAASAADAATELKVDVYEGPKECDESEKVSDGRFLKMHYTGTIDESSETGEKKKQFDSSRTRGQTFDFQIGQGRVIKGWDQGLLGLCKGAKANLVIPPDMGYGASGAGGDIPGGATLHFDVEVVDITDDAPPEPPMPNVFKEIDADEDGKLTKEEVAGWFKEKQGRDMPDELWGNEDKDEDGFITWDEFSGPKGTRDEL
uniref:peptidylprolyl isomerase n=1 Tax=Pseudictyota dubia TaxID=2749911 RepID=A0A7R9W2S5_9STRA